MYGDCKVLFKWLNFRWLGNLSCHARFYPQALSNDDLASKHNFDRQHRTIIPKRTRIDLVVLFTVECMRFDGNTPATQCRCRAATWEEEEGVCIGASEGGSEWSKDRFLSRMCTDNIKVGGIQAHVTM